MCASDLSVTCPAAAATDRTPQTHKYLDSRPDKSLSYSCTPRTKRLHPTPHSVVCIESGVSSGSSPIHIMCSRVKAMPTSIYPQQGASHRLRSRAPVLVLAYSKNGVIRTQPGSKVCPRARSLHDDAGGCVLLPTSGWCRPWVGMPLARE